MIVKPRMSTATIRKMGSNGDVNRPVGFASDVSGSGGVTLRSYPQPSLLLPSLQER